MGRSEEAQPLAYETRGAVFLREDDLARGMRALFRAQLRAAR
jgi:hypothetical protein